MGKHSYPRDRRFSHAALLGLAFLSTGSPVGLLMAVDRPQSDEPSIDSLDDSWLAIPQGKPNLNLDLLTPSKVVEVSKTHTKVPVSKPTPTVTTRPSKSRPTVAQRQIAKASQTPTTTTITTTTKPTIKALPSATTTSPVKTVATTKSKPATTTTTTTTTTPTKTSEPPPPATNSSRGDKIVAVAKTYVGRNLPYRMGGDSLTTGIDCSHFVHRVLTEAGLSTSYRDSSSLAAWTQRTNDPQPGDLVLYSGHVGIYAGNGMMVHHGKAGGAFFIKVYTQNFIGYGRIPI